MGQGNSTDGLRTRSAHIEVKDAVTPHSARHAECPVCRGADPAQGTDERHGQRSVPFSANKNETLQNVASIASGGEDCPRHAFPESHDSRSGKTADPSSSTK